MGKKVNITEMFRQGYEEMEKKVQEQAKLKQDNRFKQDDKDKDKEDDKKMELEEVLQLMGESIKQLDERLAKIEEVAGITGTEDGSEDE